MIIYISMLIVIFLMYCVEKIIKDYKGIKKMRALKVAAFFTFGYIIFWTGIRNAFVDTAAYIRMFQSASWGDLPFLEISWDSGWGFDLLMIIFKTFISQNYHVWLMFLAIVSGVCVAVIFWKYSINYYYTVFLFMAMTTFTWLMNGIRQFLAAAIIFACTPLLEKKKWFLYCLVVVLCATIHGSCLIMLPICFFVQGKPWTRKTLMILVGVCLVLIFTSQFTSIMDSMLEETKWATMSEDYISDDGVNPLRVLVYSVPVVLAFIGKTRLKDEPVCVDIFTNMSIFTVALYAIGMVTNGLMLGRMPIYTQMYGYILLPYIIERCFNVKSRRILYWLSIICYLFYFYLMSRGFYYSSDFTGRIY